ncbi:MAG: pilus assembly protein [Chloroflexi bacterium]|nr:pilus assembly protein [Chloroflexota bacterium]
MPGRHRDHLAVRSHSSTCGSPDAQAYHQSQRRRASLQGAEPRGVRADPARFLLVIGGALDLGRLFYAYVAIENAAKEGALYGALYPRCDLPKTGRTNPDTVSWHAQTESVGLPGVNISIGLREFDHLHRPDPLTCR